jgi:hypothetical protein
MGKTGIVAISWSSVVRVFSNYRTKWESFGACQSGGKEIKKGYESRLLPQSQEDAALRRFLRPQ